MKRAANRRCAPSEWWTSYFDAHYLLELTIPLLRTGEDTEREQRAAMAKMRAERDDARCMRALDALRAACRENRNVMPCLLEAAHAYCTLYEIRAAMEDVFGAYREPVLF